MHINKKKLSILIFTCMLIGFFYRYNQVNKDIPKEYEKEEFHVGDKIELDNVTLEIKKSNIVALQNSDFLILDVNVKNTTKDKLDASSLISGSKIGDDFILQEVPKVGEENFQKIRNLKGNSDLNLSLKYELSSEMKEKLKQSHKLTYYIPNELFKNEIIKKYKKENKLYYKCVLLET